MRQQTLLRGDQVHDGRIEVTRTRSHHQPLEGCHAHRGVHRVAAADRRGRAAVAEVQSNHMGLLSGQAAHDPITVSHIPMRCTVEAVAADAVSTIQVVRHGVQVRLFRDRCMERGIEHRYLRYCRAEDLSGGSNSSDVIRIMQGSQVDALLDTPQDFIIDERRFLEQLAPMDDAVPHGVYVG